MEKIDIKDYLSQKGWDLSEKELTLFERCTGGLTKDRATGRPDLERGILLYTLVKRNKIKKALDIGTAKWFSALSMAIGGAWVVTLDIRPTTPTNWGIMNAYSDKVFQVVQRSQDYLHWHATDWEIVFVDGDHEYEGVKKDLQLIKDHFTKYLVIHDYGNLPAVTRAVDEVLGKPPVLVVTDRRWFNAPYEKKPLRDFSYGVAIYEK